MLEQLYLLSVITRFKEYKVLGDKTFNQLSGEQMNFSPNEDTNSIATIIQHLHGNMLSRWTNFLTEDGEKEWRKRDDEFEAHQYDKEQLLKLWEDGWSLFLNTLESLTGHDLVKNVSIRNQPLTVVDAINRQLAHYSYHVGQVIQLGKWIKGAEWQSLSIPKKKTANGNGNL